MASEKGVRRKADADQPFLIGDFLFTSTGVDVQGKPTWESFYGALEFAKRANRCSGWWLADMLRYGDTRKEWATRLEQVVDATGLSEKTLKNVRAIGAIDKSRRRDGIEFSQHAEVAALAPAEQTEWLEKAESHGWDRRELRANIRASKRRKVIEGQAMLEGMYRVIYADPPWLYGDSGATADGSLGKAERHYAGMPIADICRLPVAAHTLPDAVLFLWVTAPMLYENPGPREVMEAWGFTPKTGMVWDKVLGNYGHYVHGQHEHLLIGTRGSCQPDRPTPAPKSVQVIRRGDLHSGKPVEFRAIIEQLYDGPRLELFARERVEGWDCFGNDARLWTVDAEQNAKVTP